MLRDGTYAVRFKAGAGGGAGVVVLSGEKLRGGDSAIVYEGTISQDRDNFTAHVQTRRHTAGMPSVLE